MTDQTILTAATSDVRVADAMIAKLITEDGLARSAIWRNRAISAGILTSVLGLSAAACIWAYNQKADPEALKQALAKMPPLAVNVTLDPDAKVKLADSEIRLANNVVTLKDGGMVGLKNGGVVDAKLPPMLPEVKTQEKTEAGDVIKHEVTVFNTVSVGTNREEVITGWVFASGGAKVPVGQFCYLSTPNDNGAVRVELASNRQQLPSAATLSNSANLLTKCVWFSGQI